MRTLILIIFSFCSYAGHAQVASVDIAAIDKVRENAPSTEHRKQVEISVRDMKTREVVPFFIVDFTSCGHPMYESNGLGVFSMEANKGFSCYVRIAKRGYANLDLMVDYDDIGGEKKKYSVFLSRSPNYFTGQLKDTLGGNLYVQNARLILSNLSNGQVQKIKSDNRGDFSFYLVPNANYKLIIAHQDYHPFQHFFSTDGDLDGREIRKLFLNRMDHKKIPTGLGNEVAVSKKNSKLVGINYYSVQIIAKSPTNIDISQYKYLEKYGEVYVDSSGSIAKVKVGKFFDKGVAEGILDEIRRHEGIKDAFLTQFLAANKFRKQRSKPILTRERGYMVRLASFLNPENFDGSKVQDLGRLGSVQKNEWTIMLLSGYDDLDQAREALLQARANGFKTAYIVKYEGSTLRKVHL